MQQEKGRTGEQPRRRDRGGAEAFWLTRVGEGGRAGLRPAEWESRTLAHKPPVVLCVGL
jgi:hypothetical protein